MINEYYENLSSTNTRAAIFKNYISYETAKDLIESELNLTVDLIRTMYPDPYDFLCSLRDGKQDINDY